MFQKKYDQAQGMFTNASNAFDIAKSQTIQLPNGMSMKNLGGMTSASAGMQKFGGMAKGAQGAMSAVAIIDKIVNGINGAVQQLKGILDDFANTLDYVNGKGDKLRDSDVYGFMSAFSQASQGAADGWNSLKNGDVMGTARGVIKSWTGWYTGFAQHHNNKIEHQIVKLREDVSKIEGYEEIIAKTQERTLGYDRGNELRRLGQRYAENDSIFDNLHLNKEVFAGEAMKEFYGAAAGAGNSYQQQFELLKRERQDYVDMYNLKHEEKGDHKQDLLEYKKKIAELDDKLLHFVEDTAKNLWGIDVKGWADQVSDAICNAFENGEDAAKAFKDTAEDILRSVANNIIKMGVIQPMFEKLNRKLFGYDDEEGNYKAGLINIHDEHAFDDPDKLAKIILGGTAQFLNNDFKNMQTTAHQVYTGINRLVESSGYSLKKSKDGGNSTLSSGIQGMSENTAGLLAGYVNALRQDVSYIRLIQTTFTNEIWKDYIQQVTGMGGALTRIDENVAAIRSVISENGALYQKIEQMAGDLHNVIFGNERVRIE